MTPRLRRAILCGLIAFAMALGMVASVVQTSVSHNPLVLLTAEAERHALLEQEIAAHGHSHDDGYGEERQPGHSHGHNPADHSHDIPSFLPKLAGMTPPGWQTWPAVYPAIAVTGQHYPFERPPRLRVIA